MWSLRVTIVTMETQRCCTCHSQQYKDIESVALKYNNTFLLYCQPQVAVNNAKALPVAIDMQQWFCSYCCRNTNDLNSCQQLELTLAFV